MHLIQKFLRVSEMKDFAEKKRYLKSRRIKFKKMLTLRFGSLMLSDVNEDRNTSVSDRIS